MKRTVLAALLLLAVAGLAAIAWPDGAAAVDPAAAAAGETRTVTVTGSGTVSSTPDRAEISAGVESQAATARAALAANAAEVRRVIEALRRAGAADVHTQTVSLSPRTTPDGKPDGFTAANTVAATIAVGRAGATIDAAVDAGANVVWGPTLSSSDATALYRDALKRAVADARSRAEVLAAAAGRTLGEVTAIVEGGGDAPEAMYAKAADSAGTPVEPGTRETAAAVTVTYELR